MPISKLSVADVSFQRSPGQDGEIFTGDLIDARQGGPVTIGFGRYGANAVLTETMAVDDTMIIIEGRLTVSAGDITVTGGTGDVINMPKGEMMSQGVV